MYRMGSNENGVYKSEIEEEDGASKGMKLMDYIPIYIPTIEKGLIVHQTNHGERFLDFLKARPTNDWFIKSGFVRRLSPFSFFRRPVNPTGDSMPSDPANEPGRRRFRVPFVRKINWKGLIIHSKKWIKSPANIALFIWLLFCAAGLLLLLLVSIGALNDMIKSSTRRKKWEEIINQILNALFTIMCLYQHPQLFHHLILVLRWKQSDRVEVRKTYCKNGTSLPHDRIHIFFVVSLLHVTCFAQYVLCGLYWGYTRKTRPDWAENICVGVGIASPVIAFLYTTFGPLAKKNVPAVSNEESQAQGDAGNQQEESEVSVYDRKIVVTSPEWIGGLFDCSDDRTVACLSCCCTCCVFGWNMERLGFGNMYVHIFTFILLCTAPLWIFSMTALNINGDTLRYVLGIVGAVLCLFGLLYGGAWRIRMRKKFKLPGNPFCFGNPSVTDCVQWFFCWCCSLAQEVRTANFYDIDDDGFYRKVTDEEGHSVLVPLPREGNLRNPDSLRSLSCPPKIEPTGRVYSGERSEDFDQIELSINYGRASTLSKVHTMQAPMLIHMDDV